MKCSWELGNILDGQTVSIHVYETVWTVVVVFSFFFSKWLCIY